MSKKEAIVAAALKLLTKNGIHATPMSAIAKEAQTGMGTIYNYFPTKETLINFIYTEIKQEEEKLFLAFNTQDSIKKQFFNYYTIGVNFFIDNPLYFKFMQHLNASPIITEESRMVGEKAIKNVCVLLEKGKQDDVIKDIETNVLLQFIGGTVLSYLQGNNRFQNHTSESIDNQLQLVWDAIKK